MTDLGLYVHLPFCRARCTYCAFAISTDRSREEEYVQALLSEIRSEHAAEVEQLPVVSVFYGGGTPSLLSAEHFRQVHESLQGRFRMALAPEISLEANPEDISPTALNVWASAGVNRVSLGVQSFSDEELYPLGRGHGRAAALDALELLRKDGRFRVSVDLILGLPGQTIASFLRSLEEAMAGGAGHLSLYMLDLEEGSNLRRHVEAGRTQLPEDDLTAAMYEGAVAVCSAAGFTHYEVSNFARPGEECLHNLRYWRREPYLGLGLGAHSFVGRERFANTRDLATYLQLISGSGKAEDFRERISEREEREEYLFLSLRQAQGVHYADLVRLCGREGTAWVERGLEEGWLRRRGDQVAFTPGGFLLSTELIAQLF